MLGDDDGVKNISRESTQDIANNRFSTANLYGKVANISPDLGSGAMKDLGTFKSATGGERGLRAEIKGQQAFTFRPAAKHLFAGNTVPDVRNADSAFYARWTFVEFPETVPEEEQDETLDRRLSSPEGRSAILLWALEGYRRLFDPDTAGGVGLFTGERPLAEKRKLWAAHSDPLKRFITDCLYYCSRP